MWEILQNKEPAEEQQEVMAAVSWKQWIAQDDSTKITLSS